MTIVNCQLSIVNWANAALGGLPLSPGNAAKIEALCPNARAALVAAFPYFPGEDGAQTANLSLYCRGEDYHRVLLRRLTAFARTLKAAFPANQFVPLADVSPLPERDLPARAGLGAVGRNGLLLVPGWGSYVFLGTILTDLPAEKLPQAPVSPPAEALCAHCGACVRACPTGALGEDGGFTRERCLSHLTQKKGALSPWETAQIAGHPLLWGCDFCQKACPANKNAPVTTIAEFRENLIVRLEPRELAGMTQREFHGKYADRAFAWRGLAPLRRNAAIQEKAP
jgi:epoxyqueuosine reductase QueG